MFILDHVKNVLNRELELVKQSAIDEYDEGCMHTLQDIINLIRAEEACFDEKKWVDKRIQAARKEKETTQ
jgi:hypothetical protein